MGEIFKREATLAPAAGIGRRPADQADDNEAEHHHRYLVARGLCCGRTVLDVAGGEGYGAAMLAQVASRVVACAFAPSLLTARRAFRASNLSFVGADARALPFTSGHFDLVVCFATLERFTEHGLFLAEVRRVLRRGGQFLFSTPDRDVYSPLGTPPNPHHRQELTRAELLDLIRSGFAHVALARQRFVTGSTMLPEGAVGAKLVFERRADTHYEADSNLPRSPNLLCLASDQPVSPLPVSVLVLPRATGQATREAAAAAEIERLTVLCRASDAARSDLERRIERAEGEAARLAGAMSALAELRNVAKAEAERCAAECNAANMQVGGLRHALRQATDRLTRAGTRATTEAEQAAQARAQVQSLVATLAATRQRELATEDRLAAIERSTSWRSTAWLRRFGSRHPWLARQVRRAALLASWTQSGELRPRLAAWRLARRRHGKPRAAVPRPPPLALPEGLALPSSDSPELSIIIPSFGQAGVTLRCLMSLAAATPACTMEVLVADDASGDPELDLLAQIPGLRLLRNRENLGFLRNCNAAAAQVRGRWLLLLNNDTELRPGAIDALLSLAKARADVGLVGAKLLYPDGRLQEAGGIIWADGSGWNYGNGSDPRAPEFNYVREADYCSAAAVLIGTALFRDLGGFDERYVPAYCEDSDLAFRIRERGLKVLYQPAAEVVHHEGLSHGTDTGAGIKAFQVTNQRSFRSRWAEVLRQQHFPNGTEVLRARDRAHGRPVCLVIDHYVPEPDRDAGSCTVIAFIRTLQAAGWVVKFWPDNQAARPPYAQLLQQAGVEVVCGLPRIAFDRWVATYGGSLDHVLLSRPTVAPAYLSAVARHAPQAAVSFYGHDLHAVRMRREAALSGDPERAAEADAMEAAERMVWREVDAVLYPSDLEAEAVRRLEPSVAACAVTPYCCEVPAQPRVPSTNRDLLFVAGFGHPPNLDAALWLVRDILPLIRSTLPQVRLALVGSNPTDAIRALAGEGVEVTGYVTAAELNRRYMTARAAVVPLRAGAGVKAKVVEALAAGLPLVTTAIGAEGLPGVECAAVVAEEPAAIAAALVTLLRDDVAWLAASRLGTAYAASHFGAARMRDTLLAAMQLAAQRRAARQPAAPE